jgi:hypothetical protein
LNGAEIEQTQTEKAFGNVSGNARTLYKTLSKFGVIFKMAYIYGSRAWLMSFIMYPVITLTTKADISAELSDLRYCYQVGVEAARHGWIQAGERDIIADPIFCSV